MVLAVIEAVYRFLWGDLFTIPIGNGNGIGIPLLVLLLIPTGIYFTIRTKFLPVRLFPDMIRALGGKRRKKAVCHRCRPCLCRQRPVWEWGISSELSLRSLRAVREPCSGCGSRRSLVPPRHLWRQPWRIYTKKKIRSTADITAVRLIISTAMRSA